MPLYLVRWPDLSASLVRAANEEELTYVLDEIGNPDDCEWSPYEGPVFVDFELPVEWSVRGSRSDRTTEPDQIVIGDVGLLATMSVTNALELDVAPAEDGALMAAEVVHTAFPELHRATEEQHDRDPDGEGGQPLPEPDLREALRRELLRVHRASLDRARHEGDDAVSVLAREMDLPVSTARTYVDTARARQGNGKHGLEEPDHVGGPPPETLFQVPNYHGASSGRPPAIHGDVPGVYLGYFANEHGEQAIFVYDRRPARQRCEWAMRVGTRRIRWRTAASRASRSRKRRRHGSAPAGWLPVGHDRAARRCSVPALISRFRSPTHDSPARVPRSAPG